MKKIALLLVGAMLIMVTSAMATPISGSISFVGALNLTGSTDPVLAANATGIDITSAFTYGGKSGDYANVFNFVPVTFKELTFSPFQGTIESLWSFSMSHKTYSFDLLSITSSNVPANTLALNGSGILHITGLEDTIGIWSLTTQDGVTGDLTFSSTAAPVPEPGTMVLLGFGLLGLAIYGKRRMNKES